MASASRPAAVDQVHPKQRGQRFHVHTRRPTRCGSGSCPIQRPTPDLPDREMKYRPWAFPGTMYMGCSAAGHESAQTAVGPAQYLV